VKVWVGVGVQAGVAVGVGVDVSPVGTSTCTVIDPSLSKNDPGTSFMDRYRRPIVCELKFA